MYAENKHWNGPETALKAKVLSKLRKRNVITRLRMKTGTNSILILIPGCILALRMMKFVMIGPFTAISAISVIWIILIVLLIFRI